LHRTDPMQKHGCHAPARSGCRRRWHRRRRPALRSPPGSAPGRSPPLLRPATEGQPGAARATPSVLTLRQRSAWVLQAGSPRAPAGRSPASAPRCPRQLVADGRGEARAGAAPSRSAVRSGRRVPSEPHRCAHGSAGAKGLTLCLVALCLCALPLPLTNFHELGRHAHRV